MSTETTALELRLNVEHFPEWLPKVTAKLNELGALEDNWGSYGERRVRVESILDAARLLIHIARNHPRISAPAVVPTNNGYVVLEWHEQGMDLELSMYGNGELWVEHEDDRADVGWPTRINLFKRLDKLFRRLSAGKQR